MLNNSIKPLNDDVRQRVDLFGAQKQDLPDIWEMLVNAGFESGHAYGL
jgi:NAD(P)H-nitrite reductase large subunit